MWAGREGNDLRPTFCRIVAVVQLSNPWLASGRVIHEVDKSTLDIKITWLYGVFTLFYRQLKIVSGDKQMYFFHSAIH